MKNFKSFITEISSSIEVTPAPLDPNDLMKLHIRAKDTGYEMPDHDGIKYGEFHMLHPTFQDGKRRLYHRVYETKPDWEPKTATQKNYTATN